MFYKFYTYGKYCLLLNTIWFACTATARTLPKHAPIPGGIAIITINTNSKDKPQAWYMDKPTVVIHSNNKWVTVVGLPLGVKPGKHQIKISNEERVFNQDFWVQDKIYPYETLTVDQSKVTPPDRQTQYRILEEINLIKRTFDNWRNDYLNDLELTLPVSGRKSGAFGLGRILNGTKKAPHSGLDIAAPTGTNILAPKDGVVSITKEFYFNGNSVFIDHGQGFITNYCHLNEIKVTEGQQVKTGDLIGTVGATGRATGPHLHWSVSLNGVRVDPELFFD